MRGYGAIPPYASPPMYSDASPAKWLLLKGLQDRVSPLTLAFLAHVILKPVHVTF